MRSSKNKMKPEFPHKSNFEVKRCSEDEELILDPYITTKYVNKLRVFYLIKIGTLKKKHADDIVV